MNLNTIKRKIQDLFPKREKGHHEIKYWREVKQREGELSNRHYRHFYTEHFDLPYEFYEGKRLLDIGCGPRGSLEWADNTIERVGLDPLAYNYRALGTSRHKMKYCQSGSESIPYPDNHFDIVASFNSLDHVDDLNRTISEIKRITKPGGLFLLLSEVNHDPTPCEPISFSWDIVKFLEPEFSVQKELHIEKSEAGLYQSIEKNLMYDHQNPVSRVGIISVKFIKNP